MTAVHAALRYCGQAQAAGWLLVGGPLLCQVDSLRRLWLHPVAELAFPSVWQRLTFALGW